MSRWQVNEIQTPPCSNEERLIVPGAPKRPPPTHRIVFSAQHNRDVVQPLDGLNEIVTNDNTTTRFDESQSHLKQLQNSIYWDQKTQKSLKLTAISRNYFRKLTSYFGAGKPTLDGDEDCNGSVTILAVDADNQCNGNNGVVESSQNDQTPQLTRKQLHDIETDSKSVDLCGSKTQENVGGDLTEVITMGDKNKIQTMSENTETPVSSRPNELIGVGVKSSTVDIISNAVNGRKQNSFVLPRVILKQSTNQLCDNDETGGFEQCYEKTGHGRHTSSHYSTDKSGSSGYYSSNVYSTCSVDEHIYSEPVIDGLQLHSTGKSCIGIEKTKPSTIMIGGGGGTVANSKQKQEFKNLEKSLKNLEKHLNIIRHQPLIDERERLNCELVMERNCKTVTLDCDRPDVKLRADKLPTIMEGNVDGSGGPHSLCQPWTPEYDDSLMDIDLNSFLLANEVANKETTGETTTKKLTGIDNPTFRQNETPPVEDQQHIENAYKCTKYVNSCPDNAYSVDGFSEEGNQQLDQSLALYLQNCQEQVKYQTTKDILEEIREKLNAILLQNPELGQSDTSSSSQDSFNSSEHSAGNDDSPSSSSATSTTSVSPLNKDYATIQQNIIELKTDLDEYLKMMNQNNELELRQFCNGLSKNYKRLTIQNAMENKSRYSQQSIRSDGTIVSQARSKIDSNYEEMLQPSINGSTLNSIRSFGNHHDSVSYSDSNFKLKRNPKLESHYDDLLIENGVTVPNGMRNKKLELNLHQMVINERTDTQRSHIQQTLARQNPVLMNKLKANVGDDNDGMLELHKNKPSIWEQYYGSKRLTHSNGKVMVRKDGISVLSYPSTRPESDFTLDLPRAEQLRIKMKKEKRFRNRCRIITTFLSLVFFLITVMVVSMVLTRGKRMFGSML